jgi:hypothetical protein
MVSLRFFPSLAPSAITVTIAAVAAISLPARPSIAAEAASFEIPERPFLIKPYIEVPGLNLELRSINSDKGVIWSPNYRAQTGLSVSYQGLIGVSASAKGEISREDASLKGRSDYTDFRFRFPWRRTSVEFGYQRLKGFFAENTDEFAPGTGQYLMRPELALESKYLGVTYAAKPDRYSLAAAFDQSERQTSSGGTWLLTMHVADTIFEDHGGTPLIPNELQSQFPTESQITKGDFLSITMGGGYGQLWTFGETGYAFSQLLVSVGTQIGRSSDGNRQFSDSESAGFAKLDLGIGSNGKIHVTGLLLSIDQTTNKTAETELGKRNLLVHLFYGFRL